MKTTVYQKIMQVLVRAGRPLAPHMFDDVVMNAAEFHLPETRGRAYSGCSESALGRRLREMREMGMVKSRDAQGAPYKVYEAVEPKAVPEAAKAKPEYQEA